MDSGDCDFECFYRHSEFGGGDDAYVCRPCGRSLRRRVDESRRAGTEGQDRCGSHCARKCAPRDARADSTHRTARSATRLEARVRDFFCRENPFKRPTLESEATIAAAVSDAPSAMRAGENKTGRRCRATGVTAPAPTPRPKYESRGSCHGYLSVKCRTRPGCTAASNIPTSSGFLYCGDLSTFCSIFLLTGSYRDAR